MTTSRAYGMLAAFGTVGEILAAAKAVKDAGFTKWDCHTPFPVHGLDKAMGVRMTKLPWIVLCFGVTGLGVAIWLQWWTNAVDYPFIISGKPLWSIPANVPVMFELTVLFSALSTFFGMWMLNRLPRWYHPLFSVPSFRRATSDRFFIAIEAGDPLYQSETVRSLLEAQGAESIEAVDEPVTQSDWPPKIKYAAWAAAGLLMLPPAFIVTAKFSTSETPRFHLVSDMDHQPKFKAQAASSLFADGRAMRMPIEGTVARGELLEDEAFNTGMVDGEYLTAFPLPVDEFLMERGRERFNIYCTACHGVSGLGDGMVNQRAQEIISPLWVPPFNLHADTVTIQPTGQIFQTITRGVRNMPGYAQQIPPRDRWAIALYVKALQRSQASSLEDVPPQHRDSIR
jgi:mono/diheme cytochrome c family protein